MEVDARSSDAIALALRFQCPVYTYEFILGTAGVKVEEDEETEEVETAPKTGKRTGAMTVEELRGQLEEALENEDYERASKLRDEIKRREQTN
jgi:bifunctional DNase/RNase